jgi:hypothetical protein
MGDHNHCLFDFSAPKIDNWDPRLRLLYPIVELMIEWCRDSGRDKNIRRCEWSTIKWPSFCCKKYQSWLIRMMLQPILCRTVSFDSHSIHTDLFKGFFIHSSPWNFVWALARLRNRYAFFSPSQRAYPSINTFVRTGSNMALIYRVFNKSLTPKSGRRSGDTRSADSF